MSQNQLPPRLTLYYREGCHLCEDMEQQLPELLEPGSYRLEKIDIDADHALRASYNVRVPVLCCDDEEVCEHFLDLEALRRMMNRSHVPGIKYEIEPEFPPSRE